jgi:hypothetical protein
MSNHPRRAHPALDRSRALVVGLALASSIVSVACDAPPRNILARLGCDGGACSDAGAAPSCVGAACGGYAQRPAEPYVCAPGVICEAWQDCLDGVCTGEPPPAGTCLRNEDCAPGEVCAAEACVPERPSCRSSSDCAPGEACLEGACVGEVGCAADADCLAGSRCIAGSCSGAPAGCVSDADCTGGLACVSGSCRMRAPEGGGCLEDEHCH